MRTVGIALSVTLLLLGSGCVIAPLRVAEPLEVIVTDAQSGTPIAEATVIYLVCDVHDFGCKHAKLVRATSALNGEVKIDGQRKWGVWVPAPGGLPAPNHFIAIWAPGYSAFVFSQYGDNVESLKKGTKRADLLDALNSVPSDQASSDPSLNSKEELIGGKIRLRKSQT
jgi:hypothetical protein